MPPEQAYYVVAIVPPESVRPAFYAYMDKIRNRERSSTSPRYPHLTITGLDASQEKIEAYVQHISDRLLKISPFKLEVGKPGVMAHESFKRNLSLQIPSTEALHRLCSEIILETANFLEDQSYKRGLESLSHHVVMVEGFPMSSISKLVGVANQYWSDLSFNVDHICLLKYAKTGLEIAYKIPFVGYKKDAVPKVTITNAQAVLAFLFAYSTPLRSKLRLQKLMFLLGEEFSLDHFYQFGPAKLGPYSQQLDDTMKTLIHEGIVGCNEIPLNAGRTEPEYYLTPEGKKIAGQCYEELREQHALSIASVIKEFQHRNLKWILDYVHGRWPSLRKLGSSYGEDTV